MKFRICFVGKENYRRDMMGWGRKFERDGYWEFRSVVEGLDLGN